MVQGFTPKALWRSEIESLNQASGKLRQRNRSRKWKSNQGVGTRRLKHCIQCSGAPPHICPHEHRAAAESPPRRQAALHGFPVTAGDHPSRGPRASALKPLGFNSKTLLAPAAEESRPFGMAPRLDCGAGGSMPMLLSVMKLKWAAARAAGVQSAATEGYKARKP